MPDRRFRFALSPGPVAAAILFAAIAPAAAQYYPPAGVYVPAPPPPPPMAVGAHDAQATVRSLGLRPVSHVRVRGPILVIDAVGQEGSLVRVSIDRHSGRVTQIVRMGRGAPRIVSVPGGPAPHYEPDDEEFAELERDLPRGHGPRVITRQGIDSDELPPPGADRGPYVTGSVPRDVYRSRGNADPLRGVPPEFRREHSRRGVPAPRPRVAALPSDPAPRAAPVPQPRPADAPAVAQKADEENASAADEQEPVKHELSPAAKEDIRKFPPAQGFE